MQTNFHCRSECLLDCLGDLFIIGYAVEYVKYDLSYAAHSMGNHGMAYFTHGSLIRWSFWAVVSGATASLTARIYNCLSHYET